MERHLKKHIPKLLAQQHGVFRIDGFYRFVALLKKIAADALVILLAVPRAAVRRTQNRDDFLEIFQCITGFSYIFQHSFHILPYPPAFCKYFSSLFVIFSPFGSALMSSSQIPRAISRKTT